jgi:hypothetical protein
LTASILLFIASFDPSGAHSLYPVAFPDILVKISSSVLFLSFSLWLFFTVHCLAHCSHLPAIER